ncbi:MAG TPA: hypothetical protein VGM56_02325 [Byssovorax sp.]|jgi:hypothetical protein
MTSAEVRRRALRAAAAVTFGVAMIGCAGTVIDSGDGTDSQSEKGTTTGEHVRVPPPRGTSSGDASGGGETTATTTASSGSGAGGHAGVDCSALRGDPDPNAYSECCDAVDWDIHAGCEAWGPPMPPSMDWQPAEVLS